MVKIETNSIAFIYPKTPKQNNEVVKKTLLLKSVQLIGVIND